MFDTFVMLLWLGLTIVYMIIIYAGFNSRYTMITSGGIQGRAKAHFNNLITVGILSFFLAALTIYFFEWLLTSKIFWGIMIIGGLLWFFLSNDKKKILIDKLDKSNLFIKFEQPITDDNKGKMVFYLKKDSLRKSQSGNYMISFIEATYERNGSLGSITFGDFVFNKTESKFITLEKEYADKFKLYEKYSYDEIINFKTYQTMISSYARTNKLEKDWKDYIDWSVMMPYKEFPLGLKITNTIMDYLAVENNKS